MEGRTIPRPPVLSHLDSTDSTFRARCYGCFRPVSECYCDAVPSIENKTEFLILQHVRERGHPFNTARMVHAALCQSKLLCGSSEALSKIQLPLRPRAGLLFPSNQAKTLAELPPSEKPEQLVIIDGTWSQARTMVRDLGQLKNLPHYKLAPTRPGQYRIRLEPNDTSLSTVEAAVEALREIEPKTVGLDQLLIAFEKMVQRQLDHPRVGREHYSGGPKSGRTVNIPHRLRGDPSSIVVAYGESGYRESSNAQPRGIEIRPAQTPLSPMNPPRFPLFWVAQRLRASGSVACETFSRALTPDVPLTDSFLAHLELAPANFNKPVSLQRFREDWRDFLQVGDTVAVYNQGSIRLLENANADFESCLSLKSINIDPNPRRRTLSQFVEQEKLVCQPSDPKLGRAGKRLANAVALVQYLRDS